jgi:hypothetical protein
MSDPNYKTTRLSRGRHHSPDEGACVMELASMLAHEPFTDHPRSVCPVIGEFLRTYNDCVDEERRQDLYPYASAAVGTRQGRAAEQLRARLCAEAARGRISPLTRMLGPWRAHSAAHAAARLARADQEGHVRALELLDRLVEAGREEPVKPGHEEPATERGSALTA